MDIMLIALWVVVVILVISLVTLFDHIDDMKRHIAENDAEIVRLSNSVKRRG